MDKLLLFDIDKTLIKSSTGHKSAFSEAFKKVYGVDASIDIVNYHGMTDWQIIIEVLKKKRINEEVIESKLKKCIDEMVRFYEKNSGKDEVIILDGVSETLDILKKKGNILLGLVTGSLEAIAWSKLKKVGINSYFTVGGFGSDDINRVNLVKLAMKRAEEKFNIRLNNNIFVVGDTPQDIKAAKKVKIKTIGVTTGIYTKEDLKESGADYIVENLKELLSIV